MAINPQRPTPPDDNDTNLSAPVPSASADGTGAPDLIMVKTKLPERTVLLLDELLSQQHLTRYEFLQMCVSLYITFAKSDHAWIETSDQFKHPFLHAFDQLMDQCGTSKEFLRTFRQMEGLQDIKHYNLEDRIESVVTTFKGGQTATMQNPGLFAEFSYSANDALDSVISHITPLQRVLSKLQAHYGPDKTTCEILLLALCDHLEDITHKQPQGTYTQNEYGNVPKRTRTPTIKE